MAESDFDIDAAEQEYEESRGANADDPKGDDPKDADDPKGDPPGFKSYDEYIADGGDPDQYVGKQAYEDRYQNIQENKRLRKDVKGLQSTVQQTMDAVTDWKSTEQKKIRAEVEVELNEAMENEDPKAAVAAQKKLDDLDDDDIPDGQPQPEHPLIADFRDDNPIIDPDHDDYNDEFNADVEALYRGMWMQLTFGGKRAMTDGQIKRCLRHAMKEAKALHELDDPKGEDDETKPGESRRNKRSQRTNRSQRRTKRTDPKPKAEEYVIDNPTNQRQANAAPEIRDRIKKAAYDGAKKAGLTEEDAQKRGTDAAERFEASLART